MRSKEYDALLKIVMVGNSAVGKSSLLLRFAEGTFNQNFFTTIGVDFRFKTLHLDSKVIKLQIWDTAGQQKFRTINNTYYKNAQGIIFVFDVTSKESMQDIISFWLNEVQTHAAGNASYFLVANKTDLLADDFSRDQYLEKYRDVMEQKKMRLFFTSAKTAANVKDTFEQIAAELYEQHKGEQARDEMRLAEKGQKQPKSKKCPC